MSEKMRKIAGIGGSALLLASMGASGTLAFADQASSEVMSTGAEESVAVEGARVACPIVQGVFAFTQSEVTPLSAIVKNMGESARYLCGSAYAGGTAAENVEAWEIAVGGAVRNAYVATAEQIMDGEDAQTAIMGCSCAGNPADGAASINAAVTGVSVSHLLAAARPAEDANTVVFSSADGYEVALPLRYLEQRYAPLVFAVNGSPLDESMGGANQLWLGSTSARYFARDIIAITVETRDTSEVPAAPGIDAAERDYANLPNVGVAFGGTVK
ncbi:molybdopterin-dependent oxidoreductase [Adlercreutzia sp. R25]|uniref:molybdopterin-dependent oxidoreductase n=1 Tax=Adlercreutzia shanghongiae TaxID=3111773 RepID=UPI002DBBC756|nr:molybdopterin-dependent oxidoreductase [Adlercreutzia sp. R25]MEC4271890.1 molybdopterin-dependent oxidoreductase [Adlercreutzia sp. R25]